ncbi:unnamed protein product [Closterium sp. Yama58-4]|nr:unnamed protein product [Closterium sp. Yama58-4]
MMRCGASVNGVITLVALFLILVVAAGPASGAALNTVGTRVSINGRAITFNSLRCVDILPAKGPRAPAAEAARRRCSLLSSVVSLMPCDPLFLCLWNRARKIAKPLKSVRCIIGHLPTPVDPPATSTPMSLVVSPARSPASLLRAVLCWSLLRLQHSFNPPSLFSSPPLSVICVSHLLCSPLLSSRLSSPLFYYHPHSSPPSPPSPSQPSHPLLQRTFACPAECRCDATSEGNEPPPESFDSLGGSLGFMDDDPTSEPSTADEDICQACPAECRCDATKEPGDSLLEPIDTTDDDPPLPAPSPTDPDVCGNSTRNPCKYGSCISGGPGSYTCVCPPNRVPSTSNGYPTCNYGASSPTLKVQGDNWRCEDVYPLYGLTLDEFTAQNNGVDCSAALTQGQTLNVAERDDLTSCSVFYFIQKGDTCESVAASLAISSLSLQQLNPGFDCSSPLPPSRSLCIEREDGADDGSGEYCNTEYSVSGTSSCAQVVKDFEFYSLIELYRLNPGLVCYSSVNANREARWPKICTEALPVGLYGPCVEGRSRRVTPSASCNSIVTRFFKGNKQLYEKYNDPCAGTIGGSSDGPIEICLPP